MRLPQALPLDLGREATPRGCGHAELGRGRTHQAGREDQLSGRAVPKETGQAIGTAVEVFLANKRVEGIEADSLARYSRKLMRFREFAEGRQIYHVQGVTREMLTRYAETWEKDYPSTNTRSVVRARLRAFLRYCYESQWIERVPPLPKITIDEEETTPLTAEEFAKLLTATDAIKNPARRARGRSLILLMRYSGLAIGDALRLPRAGLKYDALQNLYRVTTSRQKTGVRVSVPIPPLIAEEILRTPNDTWEVGRNHQICKGHPDYIFWDGKSKVIVRVMTRTIMEPVFKASGVEQRGHMKSHRLRDTFAVGLLKKGVPMEEVSKLLGHESIRTTEKHYAKWSKGRQDRVDSLVSGTWV